MRQGQQPNRRGRNRGGRKPQNSASRNYESSGPDVKIRGTAMHIAEKYASLARDAMSSGDIVAAENYLQHAEHYNRIIMASQVQNGGQPGSDGVNGANGGGYPQDQFGGDFDDDDDDGNDDYVQTPAPPRRPQFRDQPQQHQPRHFNQHRQPQPQPYIQQPQPHIQQPQPYSHVPQPAPALAPVAVPNGNVMTPPQDVRPIENADDIAERMPRRRRRRPPITDGPQVEHGPAPRNGAAHGPAQNGSYPVKDGSDNGQPS